MFLDKFIRQQTGRVWLIGLWFTPRIRISLSIFNELGINGNTAEKRLHRLKTLGGL